MLKEQKNEFSFGVRYKNYNNTCMEILSRDDIVKLGLDKVGPKVSLMVLK